MYFFNTFMYNYKTFVLLLPMPEAQSNPIRSFKRQLAGSKIGRMRFASKLFQLNLIKCCKAE